MLTVAQISKYQGFKYKCHKMIQVEILRQSLECATIVHFRTKYSSSHNLKQMVELTPKSLRYTI